MGLSDWAAQMYRLVGIPRKAAVARHMVDALPSSSRLKLDPRRLKVWRKKRGHQARISGGRGAHRRRPRRATT
jgi:hypothetical protein